MVRDPDTYVFVAGHEKVGELLIGPLRGRRIGKWRRRKAELKAGNAGWS